MLRSDQKSAANAWRAVLLVMIPGRMNHDPRNDPRNNPWDDPWGVAALSNSDYLCTSRKSK